MKSKTIKVALRWLLLAYVAVSISYMGYTQLFASPAQETSVPSPNLSIEPSELPQEAPDRLEVRYFVFGKRCSTCHRIEKLTRKAVEEDFEPERKAGKVSFYMVDCDKESNKHWLEEFPMSAKSVLILKYEDGELVDWENMTHIWTLNNDEEEFLAYIRDMVRMMLAEFEDEQ